MMDNTFTKYSIEINPAEFKAIAIYNNPNDTFSRMPDIEDAEKKTIALVRGLFKGKGKWNELSSYNLHRFIFLLLKLNEIWNVHTNISIDFSATITKEITGGGCYIPNLNTIQLTFPSVMTALHEFKHKLQHTYPNYKPMSISIDKMIEPDAIMWSHAVFKLALPKLYESNLVGRKFFQIPNVLFPLKVFDEPTLKRIYEILKTEGIKIYAQDNSLLMSIKPTGNGNSSLFTSVKIRAGLNKK